VPQLLFAFSISGSVHFGLEKVGQLNGQLTGSLQAAAQLGMDSPTWVLMMIMHQHDTKALVFKETGLTERAAVQLRPC
jgi:hypothetical protein